MSEFYEVIDMFAENQCDRCGKNIACGETYFALSDDREIICEDCEDEEENSDVLIGHCEKCTCELYNNENYPIGSEKNNVGDFDNVCYPCQFDMMDSGDWESFKRKLVK